MTPECPIDLVQRSCAPSRSWGRRTPVAAKHSRPNQHARTIPTTPNRQVRVASTTHPVRRRRLGGPPFGQGDPAAFPRPPFEQASAEQIGSSVPRARGGAQPKLLPCHDWFPMPSSRWDVNHLHAGKQCLVLAMSESHQKAPAGAVPTPVLRLGFHRSARRVQALLPRSASRCNVVRIRSPNPDQTVESTERQPAEHVPSWRGTSAIAQDPAVLQAVGAHASLQQDSRAP